jgi:GH15 family glucan-1,4-alpha-glucosidase
MPEAEEDIRVSARDLQIALVNHLCDVWREPDQGIWEVRGGPKHFTHSKVMAWVAVDRGIEFLEARMKEERNVSVKRYLTQNLDRWKQARGEIHEEVCKKAFDKKLNSFVQYYGSKTLDASCLRIALVGFLPPEDPRIVGTVEAIEKHLMPNGFVLRYDPGKTDDGLTGSEGAFLACSFWMVANLWLLGRHTDARELFERLLSLRNDVGLLSEEYDWKSKRMLGNFPQALSHIALVHAAFTISGLWTPKYTKTAATTPGGASELRHRLSSKDARSATKRSSRRT